MRFILDSNIIIYSYSDDFKYLREFITSDSCIVSEISRVEVLGYHKLKKEEYNYFQYIFDYVQIILPDQEIFDMAIDIRKKYNLKLGDSLIAATAMVHDLEIYTRNTDDFKNIKELKTFNPIH